VIAGSSWDPDNVTRRSHISLKKQAEDRFRRDPRSKIVPETRTVTSPAHDAVVDVEEFADFDAGLKF
jgi:hypothetical protein